MPVFETEGSAGPLRAKFMIKKRVLVCSATLRLRAKPVRRCRACLILADEAPDDFTCKVAIRSRRVQLVALNNGVIIG